MKQGRPLGSQVRQNIIEILYFMKEGTGYDIYKHYVAIFPKVTMRLIYYHLKKGHDLGIFNIRRMGNEKGDYSWGNSAQKVYYELGVGARPILSKRVKNYFDKLEKRDKK
jgi:hypothetical protein